MRPAQRGAGRSPQQTREVIEAFLKHAKQAALLEPGEELLELTEDNFSLEIRGSRLTLQAWDRTRNLTRRIMAVHEPALARLEMTVERFARREGQLFLLDLARRSGAVLGSRSGRLVYRERFRLFLRRQFPEWKLAEISAEANLEFSLSPAFPRAFLRHGLHGWAAIACPPEGDAAAVVSFGLIWLSYLRTRERRVALEGLAIYVPAGRERAAALRLLCLNAEAVRFELFTYSEQDIVASIDALDHGNLDTRLEPCRGAHNSAAPGHAATNHAATHHAATNHAATKLADGWQQRILSLPGVDSIPRHDGRTSLRVRGIEFGELADGELRFGLGERRVAQEHHGAEIERLVEELERARSWDSRDRDHPLYRQYPEAWLESQARLQIDTLDASLNSEPVYGQVPAFAGGERGILDLLAVERGGRLVVIELKATADLHLPLQALDYWIRVKWHLDRGEFPANGYFPGVMLRTSPPRLLLVSPALEFHSTTETILSYFSKEIEVERIGLGADWRKGLKVMFRLSGAQGPRTE